MSSRKIKNYNVELTPFSENHILATFFWIKSRKLRRLFRINGKITKKGHFNYFRNVIGDKCRKTYAISMNGSHVGNCGFKNILSKNKCAETWIYVGKCSFRGKGIGSKAMALLLEQAFDCLKLKKIYLYVSKKNNAAIRCYEKAGFHMSRSSLTVKEARQWGRRRSDMFRMELRGRQI
jgi:Acetyltransferases, including N-acetylases of ribosomal proteins